MTKYSIKNTGELTILEVKGHANAADKGEDIVCASISTAIYMTRNIIEQIEPGYNLSNIKLEEGYALFEIPSQYELANKALNALVFALNDLEKQFPKNIKKVK